MTLRKRGMVLNKMDEEWNTFFLAISKNGSFHYRLFNTPSLAQGNEHFRPLEV